MSNAAKKTVSLFYDVMSPYAWIGFEFLCRARNKWNIDLVLKPMWLAAIVKASGNVPPVPNKKAYSRKDLSRLSTFYGIPIKQPANLHEVLMVKGSLSAQRLLTSVQMMQSNMTEHLSRELWMRVYNRDQDISTNESLLEALRSIGIPEEKAKGLIESINDSKVKEKLKEVTNEALSYGAFGAPMIIARDENNKEHFLFGSDRMELLASILGEKYEGPLLQYAVTKL